MTPPNVMVIGLQIGKLHRGVESAPTALQDSEKPGLFKVASLTTRNGGSYIRVVTVSTVKVEIWQVLIIYN